MTARLQLDIIRAAGDSAWYLMLVGVTESRASLQPCGNVSLALKLSIVKYYIYKLKKKAALVTSLSDMASL
jgi:hypothetical protein